LTRGAVDRVVDPRGCGGTSVALPTGTSMRTALLFAIVLGAGLGACTADSADPIDPIDPVAPVEPEQPPPPPAEIVPVLSELGGGCDDNADCDSALGAGDGYCYVGTMGPSTFPTEGYCTVDDGSGTICAVDADCGPAGVCADSGGYRLCLPACDAGGGCPANLACFDSFNGWPLDRAACVPGDATAQDGAACAGFFDCNEASECDLSAEDPGGMCATYGCTVGNDSTCHGGTCIAYSDMPNIGTLCVDACTTNADCRGADGYVCHDPDGAGSAAAYCRHPKVGDACATGADCGGGAWTCKDSFPGGYCTLACPTPGSSDGCSIGSVCATVEGSNVCVDRCQNLDTVDTCRSGYTCTAAGIENGGACLPL